MTPVQARAHVLGHTRLLSPFGVPELRLHLVAPESEAWRAGLEGFGAAMPYWGFAWPGGVALARAILDDPSLVRGRRVLDFGCGGAVEGLAAARAGAAQVDGYDLDPLALVAAALNAAENGVDLTGVVGDPLGLPRGDWSVVLAGDVLYSDEAAARAWPWLRALAGQGALVLVGDPGRATLPEGLERLATYRLPHDGDPRGTTLWDTTVYRVPAP